MVRLLPDLNYLRECLDYDPLSGILTWQHRPIEHFADGRAWKIWNTRYEGKRAGSLGLDTNCISVCVGKQRYPAHVLIWKIMTGGDVPQVVHLNHDTTDNRFDNLAVIRHRTKGASSDITQQRIWEILDYNRDTGDFVWRSRSDVFGRARNWNAQYAGKKAGNDSVRGYLSIQIDKARYYGHRLAWIYENGPIISGEIDHINGVRNDNRIANLRLVTKSQNCQNRALVAKNTSGVLGVTFHKVLNKWRASGHLNGRALNLGHFDTIDEAARVAHDWRSRNFSHYTGRNT